MKLLVSLAVVGLTAVMAAPVEPLENELFNDAEYNEDCIEEVQAANFEPPAIFKDEYSPFADETENEDDCLDEVADAGDLDDAFNLNDINDEFQPQADSEFVPAFDEPSNEVYEFDEECEDEEIAPADANDSLLAFAVPQKDEFAEPLADEYEADCYDENAEAADEVPAVMKDEPEEYFFDSVLDNIAPAFDTQNELFEEDCVDEEEF